MRDRDTVTVGQGTQDGILVVNEGDVTVVFYIQSIFRSVRKDQDGA